MKALPQRSVPTLGLILLAAAFAAFAALAAPPAASAQSASAASGLRALDHDDYDRWNRIAGERLSPDGRWLAYALVPGDGDGAVLVRNLESGRELRLERGTSPTFTDDSRFVAVTVRPPTEVLEKAEKAKKKDDDVSLPKDSLVVVELARAFRGNEPDADAVLRVAEVKSFLVPGEERALVAYLLEPEEDDEEEGDAGAAAEEGAEEEEGEEPGKGDREKAEGSTLVLLDPATGAEHRFADATEYGFDETGRVLYYAASSEDGTADGVYRVDTANGAVSTVLSGEGAYVKLAVDDDGDVAFLTDRDDREADQPAV